VKELKCGKCLYEIASKFRPIRVTTCVTEFKKGSINTPRIKNYSSVWPKSTSIIAKEIGREKGDEMK
jgi:hypothetical protein